jgi:hypothetical protein
MLKWEYCAIKEDLGESKIKKLKYFSSSGEHKGKKLDDIHQQIAMLGEEGWELVTLTEISNPAGRVYYFKKQINK